jgi:hypothetical protein
LEPDRYAARGNSPAPAFYALYRPASVFSCASDDAARIGSQGCEMQYPLHEQRSFSVRASGFSCAVDCGGKNTPAEFVDTSIARIRSLNVFDEQFLFVVRKLLLTNVANWVKRGIRNRQARIISMQNRLACKAPCDRRQEDANVHRH